MQELAWRDVMVKGPLKGEIKLPKPRETLALLSGHRCVSVSGDRGRCNPCFRAPPESFF